MCVYITRRGVLGNGGGVNALPGQSKSVLFVLCGVFVQKVRGHGPMV